MRVAVVGSGLSAVGAIRALIKQGIRPVVIDAGETLEPSKNQRAQELSRMSPDQWSASDRAWLNANPTVKSGSIPKKLVFGSGYFYGDHRKEAPLQAEGNIPPFSYALGGLSVGWGAAVLPPHPEDLRDWPVSPEELHRYCRMALEALPYSAVNDGLSADFPVLSETPVALRLSQAGKTVLAWLNAACKSQKGRFIFGQARLLLNAADGEDRSGCQYCGQCSSGCAYGAIFKAGSAIAELQQQGKIEYLPGLIVTRVEESAFGVNVFTAALDNQAPTEKQMHFDRVFVAAGAVNSTRIVFASLNAFDRPLDLRTRGGFVLPVISLRGIPKDWPDCNTQPELFVELKNKGQHWVHAQVSLENELVVQMLGVGKEKRGLLHVLKKFISKHLFFILLNYHSEHSGVYRLQLKRKLKSNSTPIDYLHSIQTARAPSAKALLSSLGLLSANLLKLGCLPLLPLAKLNSGAYHVGATLPMRAKPATWNETDMLGRLGGWKKVHVVDTATFPSLPGTTIGLLAMANAWRITEQAMQE